MSTIVNNNVVTFLNMTTFRGRLLEAMVDKTISRAELARRAGMERSNLTHWLNGRAKYPQAASVTKVAKVLEVNPHWLTTGEGPKTGAGLSKTAPIVDEDVQAVIDLFQAMSPKIQTLWTKQGLVLLEGLAEPLKSLTRVNKRSINTVHEQGAKYGSRSKKGTQL